jgi:hypothetical protein
VVKSYTYNSETQVNKDYFEFREDSKSIKYLESGDIYKYSIEWTQYEGAHILPKSGSGLMDFIGLIHIREDTLYISELKNRPDLGNIIC